MCLTYAVTFSGFNNKKKKNAVYNTQMHISFLFIFGFNVHPYQTTHHFIIPTSEHPNPLFYAPFLKNSHGYSEHTSIYEFNIATYIIFIFIQQTHATMGIFFFHRDDSHTFPYNV